MLTGKQFVFPKGFDPKKHFDKSLGVMSGKGDYTVVIEMDPWLTDMMRGRKLHHSQEISERPDGMSQWRLRLSALEEIANQNAVAFWRAVGYEDYALTLEILPAPGAHGLQIT
jgi:hypothetical protein